MDTKVHEERVRINFFSSWFFVKTSCASCNFFIYATAAFHGIQGGHMTQPKIHFPAVLVAGAVQFAIGFVWYSTLAGPWSAMSGVTMEMAQQSSAMHNILAYGGSLLSYYLCFYILAHFMHYAEATTPKLAMQTGFWAWLGFCATSLYVTHTFAMKPITLWLIDSGYWLVSLLAGAVILAKMRPKQAA